MICAVFEKIVLPRYSVFVFNLGFIDYPARRTNFPLENLF